KVLLFDFLEIVPSGNRLGLLDGAGLVIDDDFLEGVAARGVHRQLERATLEFEFRGNGLSFAFTGLQSLLERNTSLREDLGKRGWIVALIVIVIVARGEGHARNGEDTRHKHAGDQ